MEFTEKNLLEQEQAFEALKDEFSRLNARFDGMIKESGLSEDNLRKSLEEKRSPELDKVLEQARAEAAHAGQARAAQANAAAPADQATSGGRGRPGAVRV